MRSRKSILLYICTFLYIIVDFVIYHLLTLKIHCVYNYSYRAMTRWMKVNRLNFRAVHFQNLVWISFLTGACVHMVQIFTCNKIAQTLLIFNMLLLSWGWGISFRNIFLLRLQSSRTALQKYIGYIEALIIKESMQVCHPSHQFLRCVFPFTSLCAYPIIKYMYLSIYQEINILISKQLFSLAQFYRLFSKVFESTFH